MEDSKLYTNFSKFNNIFILKYYNKKYSKLYINFNF